MKSLPTRASRRLEMLLLEDRVVPASWMDLAALPPSPTGAQSYIRPESYRAVAIDPAAVRSELAAAPAEELVWFGQATGTVFTLPKPDGTTASFSIVDSPIMEPALAAQFPDIKTYAGRGIDDPTATIRMDLTPQGFHAQILSTGGRWSIDPYYHLEDQIYVSYYSSDLPALDVDRGNDLVDHDESGATGAKGPDGGGAGGTSGSGSGTANRSGQNLRSYRAAVAATGEYTQFHGGSVLLGQGAIVTTMNRVNGIYINDLAIRMVLVANNSSLVYTSASSDPYTNSDGIAMLGENQTNVNSVIGNANYDIGHVFSTGGGGVASLGSVGVNSRKAQGVTGLSAPIGDAFSVDYVSHEMGHQFGANHTFNTSSDSNRNASTAYEPGSGSTIMGYAGITGPNSDLQNASDAMFHFSSFDEIIRHVDTVIPTVGSRTATGNAVPTVNAGLDYTIPTGTFFALTAAGTDANGDALTYSWEQRDLGPANLLNEADNGASPLFRTFLPSTSPTRTFPQTSDLLNNTTTAGEKLYTQARASSNFRVTVRDNRAGGGGVNTDDMVLNVVNTGAPFLLTSPNSATSWTGNTTQTVTWIVAGTTGNGINAVNVRLSLSTDGGLTFPITIRASTPNDGSEAITVPNVDTTRARIRVQPVNNVFFDISNTDFTVIGIPGITVSPIAGLTTTEAGGTAVFSVVLDTRPTSNVTIPISSSDTTEGTVSISSLVFTTLDWATPKFVTVTGVNDTIIDGDIVYTIVTGSANSVDAKYSGRSSPDVSVTNINDDFAGVIVTPTSGLVTTEGSTTATFTIVLLSAPSESVSIPLSSNNPAEGSVSPALVTFTTANWNVPRTITVTGVNDTVVDGDVAYSIVTGPATSADTGYSGFNAADVAAVNLNDDTSLGLVDVGSNHRYGQSVTFNATVFGLNGNATPGTVSFFYGATGLGTFPVVNGVATMSTSILPIGTDVVSASYTGDAFFQGSSSNTSVVIGRALLSIFASPQSKVYGAVLPSLFFSASGFVDGDDAGVISGSLTTTATITSVTGQYPITQGNLSAPAKYDVTFTPSTLTVTPASLSVSAIAQSKIYGEAVPALPFNSSGFVLSDSASVLSGSLTTTATAASSVGTYPIQAGTVTAGPNYTITYTSAILTVNTAPLLITPAAATKQYGPALLPPLPYTPSGFVNGDTASILSGSLATTALVSSPVGQYPIAIGTVSAGSNYSLSLAVATVSVTPAPLTVTANNATNRAGAPIPNFTSVTTGFVNGDTGAVVTGIVLSTPATIDSVTGTYPIVVSGATASNYTFTLVNGTLTLTVDPVLVGADQFAIGADTGGTDLVNVYAGDGSLVSVRTPFPGFTGGVRTAVGDVNGDGIPDLAVGTGPGMIATVQVIDGATGAILAEFQPFDDFTGGVFVSLGDMDGDKKDELVVTPDVGGGPRVLIFKGGDLSLMQNFFGIVDPAFRGGARTALGDMNADGFADLVVSAGSGGGPRVSIIDGKQLSQNRFRFLTPDFFVFADSLRDGAYVSVGDVDGDGYGDLVAGAGPGGAPRVLVLSGKTLLQTGSIAASKSPIASIFVGDSSARNGAFVSARNLDRDGRSDVVVGGGSLAIALKGRSLAHGIVDRLYEITADTGTTGGVYVG